MIYQQQQIYYQELLYQHNLLLQQQLLYNQQVQDCANFLPYPFYTNMHNTETASLNERSDSMMNQYFTDDDNQQNTRSSSSSERSKRYHPYRNEKDERKPHSDA